MMKCAVGGAGKPNNLKRTHIGVLTGGVLESGACTPICAFLIKRKLIGEWAERIAEASARILNADMCRRHTRKPRA